MTKSVARNMHNKLETFLYKPIYVSNTLLEIQYLGGDEIKDNAIYEFLIEKNGRKYIFIGKPIYHKGDIYLFSVKKLVKEKRKHERVNLEDKNYYIFVVAPECLRPLKAKCLDISLGGVRVGFGKYIYELFKECAPKVKTFSLMFQIGDRKINIPAELVRSDDKKREAAFKFLLPPENVRVVKVFRGVVRGEVY